MKTLLTILLLTTFPVIGGDHLSGARIALSHGDFGTARQHSEYAGIKGSTTDIRLARSPTQPSDLFLDELARYPFPMLARCEQLPGIPENYYHYKNNSAR